MKREYDLKVETLAVSVFSVACVKKGRKLREIFEYLVNDTVRGSDDKYSIHIT